MWPYVCGVTHKAIPRVVAPPTAAIHLFFYFTLKIYAVTVTAHKRLCFSKLRRTSTHQKKKNNLIIVSAVQYI